MTNLQHLTLRDCVTALIPFAPSHTIRVITERESLRPNVQRMNAASFSVLALSAVLKHIRHQHTDYDTLLGTGRYTRDRAERKVAPQVRAVLMQWQAVH